LLINKYKHTQYIGNMTKIKYQDLTEFTQALLKKIGLDDYSLNAVTVGLCETSLRGVDSHGVRLLPHYVDSAINGRKNTSPNYKFDNFFPSIGHLNADDAFGHAAGMKAIDYAMEMAETQGVGVVAVSNSSHPGAMASMALKAARSGYMAFAFTHADALILSHGGKRPYFGTNPICFAAPRKDKDPYCLDMATSIVAWNRVLIHKNLNTDLDVGIAVDKTGEMTINPHEAVAVMPTGSYKGYGLSSMIDVLCGIYTGMSFGRSIPSMYKTDICKPRKLGQFYIVMRTDGVVSQEDFIGSLQKMTNEVRSEPSSSGENVMLPGDKEIFEANNRLKNGIPLDDVTVASFLDLSAKYGVPLKLI
jgi:ureidoglycolate dehydrogenase (NAD+)